MKNWNKVDRYIVIGSMGILLISACVALDKILRQELKKEQIKISKQETLITETLNIKTWRRYHEEQMILMQKILKELEHQNNSPLLVRPTRNIKVNFQTP